MIEEAWSKLIEFEAAAPLPILRFRDAALLALDYFLHTSSTMSICVVSKFHTNPFATHFVGHRSRCATTEEAVKDKISSLS